MIDEVRERARTYFGDVSPNAVKRGSGDEQRESSGVFVSGANECSGDEQRESPGVAPAHDWQHVRRVARLAETLAGEYDADEAVLFAAVWLHDVGRAREDRGEIGDHAEWGAREAGEILADLGADLETIEAVQHCIRAHRYSNDVEPETLEAEILCDADNLDALGAVGVARCFSYGGEHGITLHDPDLPPEDDDSTAGETQFNHLHKKILSLRDRMYTDVGREIAEERHDYVAEFAERFEREAAGER